MVSQQIKYFRESVGMIYFRDVSFQIRNKVLSCNGQEKMVEDFYQKSIIMIDDMFILQKGYVR